MIDREGPKLSLVRQCALLGLSRSSLYYLPTEAGAEDLELMALIDRQYLKTPFYGSRRMTAWLRIQGHQVNRKRVRRLMQVMGLEAIYRRPNSSKPSLGHKVCPYLLRGTGDQPGLGSGYHLHTNGSGLPLPGSYHGLV